MGRVTCIGGGSLQATAAIIGSGIDSSWVGEDVRGMHVLTDSRDRGASCVGGSEARLFGGLWVSNRCRSLMTGIDLRVGTGLRSRLPSVVAAGLVAMAAFRSWVRVDRWIRVPEVGRGRWGVLSIRTPSVRDGGWLSGPADSIAQSEAVVPVAPLGGSVPSPRLGPTSRSRVLVCHSTSQVMSRSVVALFLYRRQQPHSNLRVGRLSGR